MKSFEERKLTVKMQTLTPLWTGGVEGSCESLKLTGILGSLRWWFEVLVRGMGYYACDSASEDKCKIEIMKPEDYLNIAKKICPACFLFGFTGFRKRLWLNIKETSDLTLFKPYQSTLTVVIRKEWYYNAGLYGSALAEFYYDNFYFISKKKYLSEYIESIIKVLLTFIQEYGMLGSKTALGYGVVKFEINNKAINVTEKDLKNFEEFLSLFRKDKNDPNLPAANDMFFTKFKVTETIEELIERLVKEGNYFRFRDRVLDGAIENWREHNWLVTSPFVRKEIRNCIRENFSDSGIRHFLMGKIKKEETKFSAIQVSHVYRNSYRDLEFRILAWLPESLHKERQKILEVLTKLFDNVQWNHFISSQIVSDGTWDEKGLHLVEDKDGIKKLLLGRNNYEL